jgi:hypothetical protein
MWAFGPVFYISLSATNPGQFGFGGHSKRSDSDRGRLLQAPSILGGMP